jgi:peroxiredoxin family protein
MSENSKPKRKLAIICSKGSLDMAYPPLILANSARMSGIEVDLFFTFWGLDMINKATVDHLHLATVGNPNMHPSFHIPTVLGILPGMSEMATGLMKKEIQHLDFPDVREFVEVLIASGAHLHACKMSMEMMHLSEDDLLPDIDVIGAMEFMEISENAQLLFI